MVTLDSTAQIKGMQDESLFFDTKNRIGIDKAQEFKKDIYPLYLSGSMELDSLENLGKFYGDLPFEEFWNTPPLNKLAFLELYSPKNLLPWGREVLIHACHKRVKH